MMKMLRPFTPGWNPVVLESSAHSGLGMDEIVGIVGRFFDEMTRGRRLDHHRREHETAWFHRIVREEVLAQVLKVPELSKRMLRYENEIARNEITAFEASECLLRDLRIEMILSGGDASASEHPEPQ